MAPVTVCQCKEVGIGSMTVYIRLNMSNMRFVMTKPPVTFTNASRTDKAPRACGIVPGRYPPPMMNKPPTPTIPLILLASFVKKYFSR